MGRANRGVSRPLGEEQVHARDLADPLALDLGFKHLSHFSKWFKRHTGRPPQAVRE